jgi:hypothetical protein
MDRAAMMRRCPGARALGTAVLVGHRFLIGLDGWGSIGPARGERVYGVLWRLTPRDRAALNAYELLDKGLYKLRPVPVRANGRTVPAVTFVLGRRVCGRPRPGYVQLVAAAARAWSLPARYVRQIERWSTGRWLGSRDVDVGDLR